MLFDPRTPRSNDPLHVYGVAYNQKNNQTMEFYDKRPCVLVSCFYICLALMLTYIGIFSYEIFSTYYDTSMVETLATIESKFISDGGDHLIKVMYTADGQDFEVFLKTSESTFATLTDEQSVTVYFHQRKPNRVYLERPGRPSLDVKRVQFLLRRIALLVAFVSFAWYILYSDRYRTPLDWLRNPIRHIETQ